MSQVKIIQMGSTLRVLADLSNLSSDQEAILDYNGYFLYIEGGEDSFIYSDTARFCISKNKKLDLTYTNSDFFECRRLVERLKGACEKIEGITEVTVENRTPFWFDFVEADKGVNVTLLYKNTENPIRGETKYLTLGDTTDRRRSRITLCLDSISEDETLHFPNCKDCPYSLRSDMRVLMSILDSLDTAEKPEGVECKVNNSRFRYRGSDRLLKNGNILAYKYSFTDRWSNMYTDLLQLSAVVIGS